MRPITKMTMNLRLFAGVVRLPKGEKKNKGLHVFNDSTRTGFGETTSSPTIRRLNSGGGQRVGIDPTRSPTPEQIEDLSGTKQAS